MLNKNTIENIFKETFESFSVKPSNSLWTKINRKLVIRDYFKLNPGKFNFYYTLLIAVATSLILYNINQSSNISDNTLTAENHNVIRNITQDNNNAVILKSEKDNNTDLNNAEIQKTELNKTENNEITNTELHNFTTETDYITEAESNNEGKENSVKLAKPYAEFTASDNVACEPVAITFNNTSENCDSYLWDFGNGETSSLKNPTFVFRTAGSYTVKLTVFSGSNSNSETKKIIVNKKPNANFQLKERNNLYKDDVVCFTNTSSDLYKSIWDFGDGNSSNNTHPQHSYDSEGSYNISLICLTDKNCADTSIFKKLQIKDDKYKIIAPNASYCDLNGQNSGYHTSYNQSNTVFYPIFNYEVAEYRLRIYNKFGAKVFESNNPDLGWNGYYNNKPSKNEEVYIWECSGKFIDGETFRKTGNLTLLHLRK